MSCVSRRSGWWGFTGCRTQSEASRRASGWWPTRPRDVFFDTPVIHALQAASGIYDNMKTAVDKVKKGKAA
jgi:hypothetical protein